MSLPGAAVASLAAEATSPLPLSPALLQFAKILHQVCAFEVYATYFKHYQNRHTLRFSPSDSVASSALSSPSPSWLAWSPSELSQSSLTSSTCSLSPSRSCSSSSSSSSSPSSESFPFFLHRYYPSLSTALEQITFFGSQRYLTIEVTNDQNSPDGGNQLAQIDSFAIAAIYEYGLHTYEGLLEFEELYGLHYYLWDPNRPSLLSDRDNKELQDMQQVEWEQQSSDFLNLYQTLVPPKFQDMIAHCIWCLRTYQNQQYHPGWRLTWGSGGEEAEEQRDQDGLTDRNKVKKVLIRKYASEKYRLEIASHEDSGLESGDKREQSLGPETLKVTLNYSNADSEDMLEEEEEEEDEDVAKTDPRAEFNVVLIGSNTSSGTANATGITAFAKSLGIKYTETVINDIRTSDEDDEEDDHMSLDSDYLGRQPSEEPFEMIYRDGSESMDDEDDYEIRDHEESESEVEDDEAVLNRSLDSVILDEGDAFLTTAIDSVDENTLSAKEVSNKGNSSETILESSLEITGHDVFSTISMKTPVTVIEISDIDNDDSVCVKEPFYDTSARSNPASQTITAAETASTKAPNQSVDENYDEDEVLLQGVARVIAVFPGRCMVPAYFPPITDCRAASTSNSRFKSKPEDFKPDVVKDSDNGCDHDSNKGTDTNSGDSSVDSSDDDDNLLPKALLAIQDNDYYLPSVAGNKRLTLATTNQKGKKRARPLLLLSSSSSSSSLSSPAGEKSTVEADVQTLSSLLTPPPPLSLRQGFNTSNVEMVDESSQQAATDDMETSQWAQGTNQRTLSQFRFKLPRLAELDGARFKDFGVQVEILSDKTVEGNETKEAMFYEKLDEYLKLRSEETNRGWAEIDDLVQKLSAETKARYDALEAALTGD